MYRFLENIWEQGKDIYYYLLKQLFKDNLEYDLYLLENNTDFEE